MPGMNMMNNPHPDDQEAAMARADLYKMANYSFKLFKMIKDGDQLEGWVQAKITKSADYIASVYHYLEYEMKFSEYGNKIENSDMYTEDVRKQFQRKLTEAKVKLNKLKKKNEKDLDEAFDDKAKVGDTKKTRTGELTKTDKGVVHKNTSYKDDGESEEKSGKGVKTHAKSQSAAEKKSQSPKLKQSPKSAKTWGMKDNEKFDNRDKVKEGMAPMNPDGATAPPPKGKDGRYPVVTSGPHKGKRWSPQTPGPTNPAMKEGNKKGKVPEEFGPGREGPKRNQAGPGAISPDANNYKTPNMDQQFATSQSLDKMAGKGYSAKNYPAAAAGAWSMDARGQNNYVDRTEPGVINKIKDKLGYDMPDPAYGPKPDEAQRLAKRYPNSVKEGSKPDFLDLDNDGNKKEKMKDAAANKKAGPQKGVNPFAKVKEATAKCNHTAKGKSCPVHGLKECGSMYEGNKSGRLKG